MPTVGIIKPSTRPGKVEELARLLPPEVTMAHDQLGIARGTRQELEQGLLEYDAKIAAMARLGVDLIHPAGVPPLLLGYEGEKALVARWEREYGVPVFTNGMSQVGALRAFNARRVIAASYFPGELNDAFAAYLTQAGFEVLASAGMVVDFQEVPKLAVGEIREFLEKLKRPRADALYLVGPAWRATLGMIEALEAEFGIPVIHHVPAQSWEIQRRFGLHFPVQGYGRLMRELPAFSLWPVP